MGGGGGGGTTPDQAVRGGVSCFIFFHPGPYKGGGDYKQRNYWGAMKPLLAKWGWGATKKKSSNFNRPPHRTKNDWPKHNTTNTKIHIKNIGVSRMNSIIRVNIYFRY